MRLAANYGHADYHPIALHARVTLGGREVKLCVHADEEDGKVEYYRTDEKGGLMVVGDEVIIATAYGDVRIIVPDEYKWMLDAFPFGLIEAEH